MSKIKDALNKQIDRNNKIQYGNTTGTILKYDETTNTCKIRYSNPSGEGDIFKDNVKISQNTGSITTGVNYTGKRCNVQIINGDIYSPVVTGIFDTDYQIKTNSDQGAYIASDEVFKTGTTEHVIAMNQFWIDDKNENVSKYQNELTNYSDIDPDTQAIELLSSLERYEKEESGITNIFNKSTLKFKKNGDIDLFTGNNTGIRICRTGNIKFYGTDIEFTNSKTETTDKSISTQLKVAQIMKICLAYDIIKETDAMVTIIKSVAGDLPDPNKKTKKTETKKTKTNKNKKTKTNKNSKTKK